MFGYVKPYKLELKLKSIYQYKSLYCGLCYHLRHNYGQLYGCILSYDITFLLTVLNALDMKKKRLNFRCPLNPIMKIEADISEKALDYAAFINYYLIYLKVEDDIMDENSILKKIVKIILKKNHKFLNKLEYYKSVADNLKNNMQQFNDFEKKETNFDDLTNCFGKLFSSIFIDFFENLELDTKIQLEHVSFNLGKWIYILDAYDDYIDDKKNQKFNLLNTLYFPDKEPTMTEMHDRIHLVLSILISKMQESVRKISFIRDKDIIENVIQFGCQKQYFEVLKKRYLDYYETCSNCSFREKLNTEKNQKINN